MPSTTKGSQMGKSGEWAMERQQELARGRQRKENKEPGNVPTALRDQHVDAQIADCIKTGLDEADAVLRVVGWNAIQPSPMKVGLLKKKIYLAYHATSVGST
jgi:hypothetical protein